MASYRSKILTLMSGTLISQAVPIVASPILTRLYTPADFGALAVFVSLITIFGTVANLRYEMAVMNPEADEDALNIAAGGVLIAAALSLLLLILLVAVREPLVRLLGAQPIGLWVYVIPPTVFLLGVFNVLNYYNTRLEQYRAISTANAARSILGTALQIALGFFTGGAFGLILGQVAMQLTSNTQLLRNVLKTQDVRQVTWERIKVQLRRYREFPLYLTPASLANTLSFNATNILLGSFFGPAMLGFYSMTNRMLGIPTTIIGASIGQVFLREAQTARNATGNVLPVYQSTAKRLALVGLVPFALLGLLSPWAFALVFGEPWRVAGEYAQLLVPMMYLRFIVSPISVICNVLEQLKPNLVWQVGFLVTSLGSLLLGRALGWDARTTVLAYGAQGAVQYVILYAVGYGLARPRQAVAKVELGD